MAIVPIKLAPETLPVAEINPPVSILPPEILAVTTKLPSVPTEVIVGCDAVAIVPIKLAPETLPTELIPKLDTQTFDALLYNNDAYSAPAGPTPIPPLLAADAVAALLAMLICKSFVVTVLELIVVVVPCTVKLPVIITLPSVPPEPFGSIVNVGPAPTIKLPLNVMPPTDIVPLVVKFPPVVLPVTLKLLNVPKLVIVGCAAVAIVPIKLAPVTLPVAEINPPVSILPPVMFAVTAKLLNVPTLVILA